MNISFSYTTSSEFERIHLATYNVWKYRVAEKCFKRQGINNLNEMITLEYLTYQVAENTANVKTMRNSNEIIT